MVVRILQNNDDLHEYMTGLCRELQAIGYRQMAEKVAFASRFISGSPTEFLHEAVNALVEVRQICNSALSTESAEQLVGVISQIEASFRKVGGV